MRCPRGSRERLRGESTSHPSVSMASHARKRAESQKSGRKVRQTHEPFKDNENALERPCTRSRRRESGIERIIVDAPGRDKHAEFRLPQLEDEVWTEEQEKALQEAHANIPLAPDVWRLIADRVNGKGAEDCFNKFYSGRMATRAAQQFRPEQIQSYSPSRNDAKRLLRPKHTAKVMAATESEAIQENPREGSKMSAQHVASKSRGRESRDFDANMGETKRKTRSRTGPKRTEGGDLGKAQTSKKVQCKNRKPRACIEDNFNKCGPSGRLQTRTATRSGTRLESPSGDETDSSFSTPGDKDGELWTKAQVDALHDAYSMIKPSVDFWSLIAKRVPGRTAEECFNKFYSSHPTPPPASQRSCSRELEHLLSSSKPVKPKHVGTKRRLLQAHKKVRKILRQQQEEDRDYETDVFAALEHPNVVEDVKERAQVDEAELLMEMGAESLAASRPQGNRDYSEFQGGVNPRFWSMKENWRPEMLNSETWRKPRPELDTPEVLKKVKNPIMLEKYIDHLHQRHVKIARVKGGKKNAHDVSNEQSKAGLKFSDVAKEVIHRAKEELRSVFGRSGRTIDHSVDLAGSDSTNSEEDGSVDTQMSF